MAAYDKIKDLVTKRSSPIFEVPMLVGALTQAEGKAKAVAKAVASIAIMRLVPMVTLLGGAFLGVRNIIKSVVKESGALESALTRISRLRGFTNMLEPLLKSLGEARRRVAELAQASNGSRFGLSQWVNASRTLEIMTKGAMGSAKSMKFLEGSAIATGSSLENVAFSYGEMHNAIANGEPIAAAAGEMIKMGLVTAEAARNIDKLQSGGAAFGTILAALNAEIQRNGKTTDDFAKSAEGLQGTLDSLSEKMSAAFGEPFLDAELKSMEASVVVAEKMIPVMGELGKTLSSIVNVASGAGNSFKVMLASIPGLSTAVGVLSKAFVLLGGATVAAGIGSFVARVFPAIKAVGTLTAALVTNSTASAMAARATAANTAATTAAAAADTLAARASASHAAGNLMEAAALKAQSLAMLSKGSALKGLAASYALASRGALGLVAAMGRMAFSALLSPIGMAIVAIGALAKVWQDFQEAAQAKSALTQMQEETIAASRAMDELVSSITTLDGAYEVLAANAARARAQMDALAKTPPPEEEGWYDQALGFLGQYDGIFFNMKKKRDDKRASQAAIIKEQEKALEKTLEDRKEIKSKVDSGALHSTAQDEVMREQARRELQLRDMAQQNSIGLAIGKDRTDKLSAFAGSEQAKADAGEIARKARADFAAATAAIDAEIGTSPQEKERRRAQAARDSASPIIQSEQKVRDLREKGDPLSMIMANALARKTALEREDIENGVDRHSSNAARAGVELTAEQRQQKERRTQILAGLGGTEARQSGDGATMAKIEITEAFRTAVKEALAAGFDPDEANNIATRTVKAEQKDLAKEAAMSNVIVSSLQKVGGGGNAYMGGTDALINEARVHTMLLEAIEEKIGQSDSDTLK